MQQEPKKIIRLETEEQLRIYMLPLRQKIMRTLRILGRPVTAKYVSDQLDIAPSSARHHLLQLQKIGLVEHDHFELINGIRAEYLRCTDVTVSIGTATNDELSGEREALTANLLNEITMQFQADLPRQRKLLEENPNLFLGDLLAGIVHLRREDAKQFHEMVRTFLENHEVVQSSEDTAWEYAILLHEVPPCEL